MLTNIYYILLYVKEKYLTRKKSYAQDSEDNKTLDLIGNVNTFIDIGANNGISCSNTFLFALRGARGICIEPVPSVFHKLKWLYRINKKVMCLNYGISDKNTETQMISSNLLSYLPDTRDDNLLRLLKNFYDKKERKERVRLVPFTTLMKKIKLSSDVDLLSIDVEGHELQVIKSINFGEISFRLIIIETHAIDDSGRCVWTHKDLEEIENSLMRYKYVPVYKSTTNTFYMKN